MTRRGILVALGLACAGCGGSSARKGPYLAAGYRPDSTNLVSLAITPPPIPGELGNRIDIGLSTIFTDTPGCRILGRADAARQRMNVDHTLVLTMNKILDAEHEPKSPSLRPLLNPKELESLVQAMEAADLLLVPGDFHLRSTSSRAFGRHIFRVYDLKTGELLLQDTVQQEVKMGGPAGERQVATEIIIRVQREFARYLLPGFRIGPREDDR